MNKGFEVICFIGDVGQKEDFKLAKSKAKSLGASKIYIEDLKKEFVENYIFPALQGNALYEGRYLLGTSLSRPLLAKAQIKVANEEGANIVSHGSTGKGNDQVRFELAYYALNPNIKIFSPWRDVKFCNQFKGRNDLLGYANEWKIPVTATAEKPYSEDENLMHISHEAGILEDPLLRPDESVFSRTQSINSALEKESIIEISFKNGIPTQVENCDNGQIITDQLELFIYLNEIGNKHITNMHHFFIHCYPF